jgi:hypothetical protein
LKFGQDARISDVYPMRHFLDGYTAYPRFRAVLMGAFAGFALLLAGVGLYGVLAQLVVQRTQEIGGVFCEVCCTVSGPSIRLRWAACR